MRSALLIIDVQVGLFAQTPQPYQTDIVINNINNLIIKARLHNLPIIFIQHEDNQQLIYHSTAWQLVHQLTTSSQDHYIRKTTPDSFLNTPLQALLTQLHIEQCIVCGYATEFCIDTTVRRAAALGYPVILVEDAHTTHDKTHASAVDIIHHHSVTLSSIQSFGVKISTQLSSQIDFTNLTLY